MVEQASHLQRSQQAESVAAAHEDGFRALDLARADGVGDELVDLDPLAPEPLAESLRVAGAILQGERDEEQAARAAETGEDLADRVVEVAAAVLRRVREQQQASHRHHPASPSRRPTRCGRSVLGAKPVKPAAAPGGP